MSTTITNTGSAFILGSGSAARIELAGATISGGRLQTTGANAAIEVVSGSNAIQAGTIVSGSVVKVANGTRLTLSGDTVGSGATVSASGGATVVLSGLVAASGTLTLNGVTSIGLGATLETLSGGTALLGGTIINSGTLFASGADSFIEILGGATINGGGIVQIGDGVVDIQSQADTENVVFVAGGTGGLEIDDSTFLIFPTQGFGGTISGFGQNIHQFIDLTAVTSNSTVSATYTSTGANSGVLTVTSGLLGLPLVEVTVAQISFVGQYSTSSFKIGSVPGGTVEITDPPVAQPGSTGAATSLAFGGHPTLAPFGGGSELGRSTPLAGGNLPPTLQLTSRCSPTIWPQASSPGRTAAATRYWRKSCCTRSPRSRPRRTDNRRSNVKRRAASATARPRRSAPLRD